MELSPSQHQFGRIFVNLFDHQKEAINRMLYIEANRYCGNASDSSQRTYSNNMYVCLPFGSGKSFICLGFIELCQPKAFPLLTCQQTVVAAKKFEGRSHINCFVIVVGNSVFIQWQDMIKAHTDFRAFFIGGAADLREFEMLFKKSPGIFNKMNPKGYEIIILKAGNLGFESNILAGTVALAKVTRNHIFNGVIYDDYDTIKMSSTSNVIPAFINVFVSATEKDLQRNASPSNLIGNNFVCKYRHKEQINYFKISLNAEFIKQCMSMPSINFSQYLFVNKNDRLIGLIRELGAEEIVTMLNGDAPSAALKATGIVYGTVTDIFKKLLDDKYKIYIKMRRAIDALCDAIQDAGDARLAIDSMGFPKNHSEDQCAAIIRKLESGISAHRGCGSAKLEFRSASLLAAIEARKQQLAIELDQNSLEIKRAIDNLRAGECQVCCFDLADGDITINRCCSVTICGICFAKSNQIMSIQGSIVASCGNCKQKLNIARDVVYIEKNFDLSKLIEAKLDDKIEDDGEESSIIINKTYSLKHGAIMDILAGIEPPGRTPVATKTFNLLASAKSVPCPDAQKTSKVLIFASFDESFDELKSIFDANAVRWLHLAGSIHDIGRCVRRFETEDFRIMFINASHYCAGLNLHFATDVIFMHKMETNIASQVIGRAHRFGRTCDLNVHFLLYSNEDK